MYIVAPSLDAADRAIFVMAFDSACNTSGFVLTESFPQSSTYMFNSSKSSNSYSVILPFSSTGLSQQFDIPLNVPL